MVKPGAAILDVGITRVVADDGKSKLVGDVHPDVAEVAGFLAPIPGGVGQMTRAMLLTNVVEIAERQSARVGLGFGLPDQSAHVHCLNGSLSSHG